MDTNKQFENLRGPRHGWSEVDRFYAEYLHLKGMRHSEIGAKLDRSPAAIESFLRMLRSEPDWTPARLGPKPRDA